MSTNTITIKELPGASQVLDGMVIPVMTNVDGSWITQKVTSEQLAAYALASIRSIITITSPGASVTNNWFLNKTVFKITANGLVYFRDVDFTQSGLSGQGDTITMTNGLSFYATQNICAEL